MSKLISIEQAISTLKEYYSFKSDEDLIKFLGIPTTTFNSWKKRGRWNANNLGVISSKCVDIDIGSLLRGDRYIGKNQDEEKMINEEVLQRMLEESQEANKRLTKENLLLKKQLKNLTQEKVGYKSAVDDINMAADTETSPQKRYKKGGKKD